MRNRILHLLLLVLCLSMGNGSAFAADESGSKCGTPAASHIYRYLMAYDTKAAKYARDHYGSLEAHAQVAINKCNQVVKNSNIDAYFMIGDCIEMTDVAWTDGSSSGMSGAGQKLSERDDVRKAWLDSESHICAIVLYPGNNSLSGNFNLEPLQWDRACGVMDAGSLVETYTLIHETGHVFGCHHDGDRDQHAYGLGYLGDKYYTVMSYGHLYAGLQPVPYFSGPDQVYNGVTLGDAQHNNARMFREHLSIVDQYLTRQEIIVVKETNQLGSEENFLINNTKILNNYNEQYKYFMLKVIASGEYSITSEAKWLRITAAHASDFNGYAVTVDYEQNNTGAPREAVITIQSVYNPECVEHVIVKQNSYNGVIASQTDFKVSGEAQSLSVDFATEGSGTLKSECDWITINGSSSCNINNGSSVTFQVAANPTSQQRVGTLSASRSGGSPTVITVTQTGSGLGFVGFPTAPLTFDSRKQTQQISFFAGQAFSIACPNWITCTKTGETGDVKVNINVEANTDASAKRTGTITFTTADGKDVRTISVSQTPNTSYTIDVTTWNPNCRAQNKLVHLTTATNWQVEVEDAYGKAITVSPMSGMGNATLDIKVTQNDGGKPRYFKVTIKGDDSCEPVTIQIEQSGFNDKDVAPAPEVEEGGKDPVVDPDPNPGTGGGNGGDNGGNTGGGDGKDPEVTPADGQTYTIRLDNAGTELYLTTTTVPDNTNVTYSLSTQPEEFYIVNTDKGFTLQSATTKKYVGYTGANTWDCYDVADTWTITSIEGISTTILKDGSVGLGVDKAEVKGGVFTNKPDKTDPNIIYHWIIAPVKGEPTVPVEPEKKVCATPVISLEGGQLAITCETPGATISYTLTMPALKLTGTDVSKLSSDLAAQELTLVVKAAAKDYEESEEASRTFKLDELFSLSKPGDVNADGVQSIEDVVRLIDLLLNKK